MGILNITADSFYDGGLYQNEEGQVARCRRMLEEGAAIVDVGAMSTRPGAGELTAREEAEKLIPAIRLLVAEFPGILLSADTYRQEVAEAALKAGAVMINDISGGGFDPAMLPFIAANQIPYILMHSPSKPLTMQQDPRYQDVLAEVMQFFGRQLDFLLSRGARDIVLDPGFGFGKTVAHNYTLLRNLHVISSLGFPVVAGLSRKSMINKVLGTTAQEALNGTTALNILALDQGAGILRVHDVAEAIQAIDLHHQYKKPEA